MGEASEAELAAVNEIDEWNAAAVEERRGRSVRELMDEFLAGRHETMKVLSRFTAENVAGEVLLGSGERVSARDFITRFSMHTSRHAGQLVAASRARRVRV